jgi:general secretion pathway protein G
MLLRQKQLIKRAGFTLMEIMVVVAIILILASAGVVVTTSMLAQAKIDRAKMDVKSLEGVVTTYYTRHQQYPQTLNELLQRDPIDNTPAPLTEAGLMDPWRQYYVYEPGNLHQLTGKPKIYSPGPPDAPVQISNWGGDTIQGHQ